MKTHLKFAKNNARADTLLVFLPGAFLKPEEFEREGFVNAVREREFAADALLVDADVSYYYDQTFIERLHHDVLQPQRALGYRSIWLVGISIGGFGALIHELAKPGAVDGIVALAPYLGRRPIGAEIHKAGGLRAWKAPEGPPPDEEVDRKLWPWLQQYASPQKAAQLPPLYLGFGLSDRFASNHQLLADALSLYNGIFTDVEIRRHFAADLPTVSVDPEQIRRVVINLIDNAIEAMEQRGAIDIETQFDRANTFVRVVVADHGPGIPPAEREKLFLPYYSTKRRGSGLGLAIVRRIVAEHGGSIDVSDNTPTGTRFAIELPC